MSTFTVSGTFGLKAGDEVLMNGQVYAVSEVRSDTVFTVMDLIVYRSGRRLQRLIVWSGVLYVLYLAYAWWWQF